MEKILIGKIVNAVGLKGEVKVYCYTDRKERFEELERIWVEEEPREIQNVRYHGNVAILKLCGIEDRNASEAQKNKGVYIEETDLAELPEGTYYIRDLIGMKILDEKGQPLGTLNNVLQNSAQDLYEIRLEEGRKILLPVVREFVLDVDPEQKTIRVRLPEGLLEL